MSSLKWNANDNLTFLECYQSYPCLWHPNNKDYANKTIRETSFSKLAEDLEQKGLNISIEEIRHKIKTLRTVYNKERKKVIKSKKSGAGELDIYKPKLIWYELADSFLCSVVKTRETVSNMENEEHDVEGEDHTLTEIDCNPPPAPSSKKLSSVERAIMKLDEIVQRAKKKEDEFDIFGKHVASQLRSLPKISSFNMQAEITNLLFNERAKFLQYEPDTSRDLLSEAMNDSQIGFE